MERRIQSIADVIVRFSKLLGPIDRAKVKESEALFFINDHLNKCKKYYSFCQTSDKKWLGDSLFDNNLNMLGLIPDIASIFEKYSNICFIAFPGEPEYIVGGGSFDEYSTEGSYFYSPEVMTLPEFKKTGYWKFFEPENDGAPETVAFVRDSAINNLYYPIYWPLFARLESDETLRNLLIRAILMNRDLARRSGRGL